MDDAVELRVCSVCGTEQARTAWGWKRHPTAPWVDLSPTHTDGKVLTDVAI